MKFNHPIDLPGQPLRRGQHRVVQNLPPYERTASERHIDHLVAQVVAQLIHEENEWLWAQFKQRLPHWRRWVVITTLRRLRPYYRRLAEWGQQRAQLERRKLPADGTPGRLPLRERLLLAAYARYLGWLGDIVGWAHTQFSVVRVAGDSERIAVDIRGWRYWRGAEDQPLAVSTEQPPF